VPGQILRPDYMRYIPRLFYDQFMAERRSVCCAMSGVAQGVALLQVSVPIGIVPAHGGATPLRELA